MKATRQADPLRAMCLREAGRRLGWNRLALSIKGLLKSTGNAVRRFALTVRNGRYLKKT